MSNNNETNNALAGMAEIQYTVVDTGAVVHLTVPKGTKLTELKPVTELLSRDIIPKIVPRGCQACLSGADYRIRERLEHVLFVDIATAKVHTRVG